MDEITEILFLRALGKYIQLVHIHSYVLQIYLYLQYKGMKLVGLCLALAYITCNNFRADPVN